MLVRIFALAASAVLAALASVLLWDHGGRASAQGAAIAMARNGVGLQLTLGIGDREPSDWGGRLTVRGPSGQHTNTWRAQTKRPRAKKGQAPPPVPPAVIVSNFPESGSAQFSATQGEFSFDASSLALGQTASFLEGRVTAQRTPAAVSPAQSPLDEDFPAAAADGQGNIWAAYVEYDPGAPVDEAGAREGRFESLEARDHGDRIQLLRFSGGAWSNVGAVTEPRRDLWRPAVVALPSGVWIVWSEQVDDNWDIYARRYDPQRAAFDSTRRLTTATGTDFNVAAAHDGQGRAWIAWQGWRDGQFDVWLQELRSDDSDPILISTSSRNDWNPSIASGGDGAVWVAWDTYDQGTYDVFARRIADGEPAAPVAIASSARFEARASVAVDAYGRAWVAYEDGPEQWGKDYGDRFPGRIGAPFYLDRYIKVRVVDADRVLQTADYQAPFIESYYDDPKKPTELRHRISMPRLALDAAGRPWLTYRRHPEKSGFGRALGPALRPTTTGASGPARSPCPAPSICSTTGPPSSRTTAPSSLSTPPTTARPTSATVSRTISMPPI